MPESEQQPVADPASLQNLHDIVVPDPVSWWPPAAGWFVLGALLLIALLLIAIQAITWYKANRYRREGQKQLSKVRNWSHQRRADAIAQADQLLKRVALAGWPRESVAELSGKRWLNFLNRTGGGNLMTDQQARVLLDIMYSRNIGEQLSAAEVDELFDLADLWIRTHDRSICVGTNGEEDTRC